MSCCKRVNGTEHFPCNDCCASNSGTERKSCLILEPDIHLCLCQNDERCCIPSNCNTFRLADTNSECCQCAEEIMWNSNTPPKPDCKWLNNFCKLRRQWSNHTRQQNCKCCNCRPRTKSMDQASSSINLIDIKDKTEETSKPYTQTYSDIWKNKRTYYSLFSYIGNIGYSSLVPGRTALISFVLLIFTALGLSSGLSVYQYQSFSKICLRYSN